MAQVLLLILVCGQGVAQLSLWFTINENCMMFSLLEISFNWFWFKEEGNVSVYIVIILLGRPRSQETHIVTTCPPHAICVKICFYANRCWNYTWKDMRPPCIIFALPALNVGNYSSWIVMWWNILSLWTNLLYKLCTLVI